LKSSASLLTSPSPASEAARVASDASPGAITEASATTGASLLPHPTTIATTTHAQPALLYRTQDRMNAPSPMTERLTTLDRMGTVIASFAAIGLMLFPVAGTTFSGMFKDVGAGKDLPLLTKLATSAWFPLLLVL